MKKLLLIPLLLLSGCGWPTDRCYISSRSTEIDRSFWGVVRVEDWGPDDWSGYFDSPEAAASAATAMGCKLITENP